MRRIALLFNLSRKSSALAWKLVLELRCFILSEFEAPDNFYSE
jgi:hypothetical protein